jgi:hypothetical protein
MGYEEIAAGVREALDKRGIAYETSEGRDGEQITIWDHNGFWITYVTYTDDENGITRSRMSVSAGFTKNRRDVDAEAFARVIEALS